jgi:hypothetical protein
MLNLLSLVSFKKAEVLGNLIIALVFENFNETAVVQRMKNSTFDYAVCGPNFCPASPLPPSAENDLMRIYLLVGVLGACCVIAILLSLMMNDIEYVSRRNGQKLMEIGMLASFQSNLINPCDFSQISS